MKIGIDGTSLTIPFPCGLKSYVENLIFNLAKIDQKNKYVIFTTRNVPIPKQNNFSLKIISNNLPLFKRQLLLPLSIQTSRVEVMHYPDVWGPIFFKSPKMVTTIHDLAPDLAYPSWHRSPKYAIMKTLNRFIRKFTISNSSFIIVPSTETARAVQKTLKPKAAIQVIHEGVSEQFQKNKNSKKPVYILAMTDFSPRKNTKRILTAYPLLPPPVQRSYKLIIVVSTSFPVQDLLKYSRQIGIRNRVEIQENVSNLRLIKLYREALCFLYPSLYEGFGLPILEAMACACPVITSNYGAMKEVAGTAAYLVNPNSPEEIAKAIENIVKNKGLSRSLELKGLKRVKSFSWRETARKTLEVYKQIYQKG